MSQKNFTPVIHNRKAGFEFRLEERFTAGLVLKGTEVKSLRLGKANLNDAFCYLKNEEIFIKNLSISTYENGSYTNHIENRDRKLLLNRLEIRKITKALQEQGSTIVPLRIFFSEKGYAKIEIAIAKGKKLFDKREDIKKRDIQRENQRRFK
jgi:SsrA-binding protein